MNLNIENWGKFKIKDIFSLENCKCSKAKDLADGNDIWYIGAKKGDNGKMKKVAYDDELVTKGNCIIFICDGEGSVGYTNYMNRDFIGSTTLMVGYNKNLNQFVGMFLVTVLDLERPRYSFGRKWKTHLADTEIKLPATKDGKPDFAFMAQHIKSLHHKPITTKVTTTPSKPVTSSWKKFLVSDVFTIQNGKGISKDEIEEFSGDFPAVQSGELNNGILGFIDKSYCKLMNYTMTDEPCLTVARTGTAGFVAFQENGCVVGDSAKILLLKDSNSKNKYAYLFLMTILNANRYKFSYGRKVTEEKYGNLVLKLPATPDGKPDYQFMENYIKSFPYSDRI